MGVKYGVRFPTNSALPSSETIRRIPKRFESAKNDTDLLYHCGMCGGLRMSPPAGEGVEKV